MRQTHYPADFQCKDTHFLAFKGNVYSIFSLWILFCISAVRTDEQSKSRASLYGMYTINSINSLTFSGLSVVKVAFGGVLRGVL